MPNISQKRLVKLHKATEKQTSNSGMELTEHSSGNHLCGPNKACELLQMLQQDNPIQVSEQSRACQKWMHH